MKIKTVFVAACWQMFEKEMCSCRKMCLMLQVMTTLSYPLSRISSETHLAAYRRFSRTVLNIISQKETLACARKPYGEMACGKWKTTVQQGK